MLTKTQQSARDAIIKKMETGQYRLVENPCMCGAKNDAVLAKKDRYGIPIRTVLCRSCGLVRSDPYYDEKAISNFYNHEYRELYTGQNSATENFFSEQRTFGRHIVAFLSSKVTGPEIKGKKIFEIGCGAGGILEAFRENGNEVFGCDYGASYIEFGKKKGLNLVVGNSELLKQFGKADIIILNHSLEHMTEPREELARITELLSPEGLLYIALPGIYSIHDTYRGNLMEYLQNAHVWYFTKKTLTSLLEKCGFQLVAGNEIIMAVYKIGKTEKTTESENPENILRYLKRTRNLHWYYGLKKFSVRHSALETLRHSDVLYKITRSLYRKIKKIQ